METRISTNKNQNKFWHNKLVISDTSKEYWLFIDGKDGAYSVSSFGRVRSNGRFVKYEDGRLKIVHERIMKIHTSKPGYQYLDLGGDDTRLVHILVAEAFIRNTLNKPCVNHKDGNKSNNNVTNLEWVTYSENERHSYDVLGKKANVAHLGKAGIDCPASKPVAMIDELDETILAAAPSLKAMTRAFKIDAFAVRQVCDGKRKHHKTMLFKWMTKQEYNSLTCNSIKTA